MLYSVFSGDTSLLEQTECPTAKLFADDKWSPFSVNVDGQRSSRRLVLWWVSFAGEDRVMKSNGTNERVSHLGIMINYKRVPKIK